MTVGAHNTEQIGSIPIYATIRDEYLLQCRVLVTHLAHNQKYDGSIPFHCNKYSENINTLNKT